MTEDQILTAVLNNQLFGAPEVDIKVPDNLKPTFAEMSFDTGSPLAFSHFHDVVALVFDVLYLVLRMLVQDGEIFPIDGVDAVIFFGHPTFVVNHAGHADWTFPSPKRRNRLPARNTQEVRTHDHQLVGMRSSACQIHPWSS
jgi:hypothetical protein